MIENSSFGGSFKRTAGGVSAVTDTDVNGLIRANRAYISVKKYILGATQTVRYSGRVCQYVALRGVIFTQLGWYRRKLSPVPLKLCGFWDGFFVLLGTLNSKSY